MAKWKVGLYNVISFSFKFNLLSNEVDFFSSASSLINSLPSRKPVHWLSKVKSAFGIK